MSRKKITYSKQAQQMAVTIIAASVVGAMIIGINNSQNLQKAMAQEFYQPVKSTTTQTPNEYKTAASASSNMTGAAVKAVNPNQIKQRARNSG